MSQQKRRVILAFYAGGEGYAEQAGRLLVSAGAKVRYFSSTGQSGMDSGVASNQYSSLRLNDEELLVIEVGPSTVPEAVRTLRIQGEPSVFFVRPQGQLSIPDANKCGVASKWQSILECLHDCEETLKATRADLIEAVRLDHAITEPGKWILDNTHLLKGSIAEIRRSLPGGFRRTLSKFTAADGHLLVCELARRTVVETNNAITDQGLIDAVNKYQAATPLSIAELWVFPVMLRFALVEAIAGLAARVSAEQHIREAAYLWANRLAVAARTGGPNLKAILAQLEAQPVALQPYFAISLAEHLQDAESAFVPAQQWIEAQLGTSLADLVRPEHNREAAEGLSVANGFNSLRVLSRINFSEFFEALSVVERELRRDPAGTYPKSDFRTRDRCRRAVESIACHSHVSELQVAQSAIEAAARAELAEQKEVCWQLLSSGSPGLETALGAKVPVRARLVRMIRSGAAFFYLAGVICTTLCFLAIAISLALEMGVRSPATLSILGTLSLFPLSELAIQIVNAFIIASFEPHSLAKLDFDEGIPAEHTTLVVVPMMLSSLAVVHRELEKLEVRFLANQDPNLFFSLFSDFTDSDANVAAGDAELVTAIQGGVEALNQRFPGDHFLLFHRNRVWSQSEGLWIGRERKRGKIEDLNQFLLGRQKHADILHAGKLTSPVRYVITLDADTQLPPGTARKMVATIAHPLNRPVLDPATRVRRRGFAIIQPRVSVGLPGATASRFTRIFADTSGTDPYCQAVSDAQQDLFGEAIFHGKAIYDVEAFEESVGHRFPAETLLSHDLIEGSYAGVGLASDIELFENMPLDYAGFCKRTHRWIRGDWQIGAWILRRVPGPDRTRERNPLSATSRWRILDNLRRSLVAVASMLLLLAGWMVSASPGAWSLVVGLAIAIPALAPVLERVARRIQGTVIGWRGAHDELLRATVMVAFLPHQAFLSADAILRVLYRTLVSRRNLLEWRTAAHTAAEAVAHIDSTMRQMAVISACSLLLTMALIVERAFAPVSVFVALWIASPGLLYWLNRPSFDTRNDPAIHANTRLLRGFARLTWRFFDDLVGPATNWLPPDNSQVALRVEVANRTSPTNIGLWLCSALAARDFGYLTADQLLERSSKTFDTLTRLQRYEGHLLNWYDTSTLIPLLPRYVSTVDSGNFLASLWVFAQGVNDVLRAPILGRSCMRGLSDTLAQLENARQNDLSVAVPLQNFRKLIRGRGDILHMIGRLRMATVLAEQLSKVCGQSAADDERAYWAGKLAAEVAALNGAVDLYFKWVETLTQLPYILLQELGEDIAPIRRRILAGVWSLQTLESGGASMRRLFALRDKPGIQPRVATWLENLERDFRLAQRNAEQSIAKCAS